MADKPILFSGPMVRAILEGRKTMTRRIVNPQPDDNGRVYVTDKHAYIGDRLWVRETWALNSNLPAEEDREIHLAIWPPDKEGEPVGPFVWYKADGGKGSFAGKWRPSIMMPRWASRITLEVTEVRVERLQEITASDIEKEGIITKPTDISKVLAIWITLWDSINGKTHPWINNPWVWVISFRRLP